MKLDAGWAHISVIFNSIQKIGPKVGGGYPLEHGYFLSVGALL